EVGDDLAEVGRACRAGGQYIATAVLQVERFNRAGAAQLVQGDSGELPGVEVERVEVVQHRRRRRRAVPAGNRIADGQAGEVGKVCEVAVGIQQVERGEERVGDQEVAGEVVLGVVGPEIVAEVDQIAAGIVDQHAVKQIGDVQVPRRRELQPEG